MSQRSNDDSDRKPPAKILDMDTPSQATTADTSMGSSALTLTTTTTMTTGLHIPTPASIVPRRLLDDSPAVGTTNVRPEHKSHLNFWKWQIYLLSLVSAAASWMFLTVVLPWTALSLLAVWLAATIMLASSVYRYVEEGYHEIVAGRGIGDYLPAWLYRRLTEESIHDFMMDPTFALENRHLLLYFLPGISARQLNHYIDQLPQRHREQLRRPGLGHLLGHPFMRLVLGDERIMRMPSTPAQQLSRPPRPASIEVIVEEPHNLDDDDESDLGLGMALHDDMDGTMTDVQAAGVARSLRRNHTRRMDSSAVTSETVVEATSPGIVPSTGNSSTDDHLNKEDEYAEEERILNDAMTLTFFDFFWQPLQQYCYSFVSDSLQPTTVRFVRYGMGVSLAAMGLGLVGYRQGVYSRPNFPTSPLLLLLLSYPTSRTIWMTATVGGVTTLVSLYARSYLVTLVQQPHDGDKKEPESE